MPSSDPEKPAAPPARPKRDEAYNAQREELARLLKSLADRHEPLYVHEKLALTQDDIIIIRQKIKHGLPFSRRERLGLSEAGFLVEKLYPDLA